MQAVYFQRICSDFYEHWSAFLIVPGGYCPVYCHGIIYIKQLSVVAEEKPTPSVINNDPIRFTFIIAAFVLVQP